MVDAGRSRPALLLTVAAVIAAGLAVRFVPLGLPAGGEPTDAMFTCDPIALS